jgi:adenine/guanine phosphoribosyltransferase-like PRPP-binding protein
MSEENLISKTISAFIATDSQGTPFWKEWNFYADYPLFHQLAELLTKKLHEFFAEVDCIISLSKSGLPLGAWIAQKKGIPLYLFTIGELFYPNGTTVIGLYPHDSIQEKKPLIVDSHVNSGGTYRLLTKVCHNLFESRIFAVLADARNEKSFPIEDKVISLFSSEDVRSVMLQKKNIDVERLGSLDFWMREEDYWLTDPAACEEKALNHKTFQRRLIDDDQLRCQVYETIKRSYMGKWNTVAPILLYKEPKIWSESLDYIEREFDGQKVDTIVATSLGAVPLAVSLAARLYVRGTKIEQFVFIGNGPISYYRSFFKSASNVILCEDIIASGGLLSSVILSFFDITENGLKPNLVRSITIFDQNSFPSCNQKSSLPCVINLLALSSAK